MKDRSVRESEIQNQIRDTLSSGPVRLFRNAQGDGILIGHKHPHTRQSIITKVIELVRSLGGFANRVKFGLVPGSGDLIGYRQVVVTPEMVGRTVAVFLSTEVKTTTGAIREDQIRWLDHINSVGGIAIIARSLEDARKGVDAPFTGVPCSGSTHGESQ